MNIDVMHVQVLVLSITVVTVCHMPHPQQSINQGKHTLVTRTSLREVSRSFCILLYTHESLLLADAIYIAVHTRSWVHGLVSHLGTYRNNNT